MPNLDRPRSPHDALFKAMLNLPDEAAGLLARALPSDVADSLLLGSASLQPGSFVDRALRQRHTDALLAVSRKAPDESDIALVYIVFEHQSFVDPMMAWRLYEYAGRVLAAWLKRNPKARYLPELIPVVLYHGRRSWTAPTTLEALVEHPRGGRRQPPLGPDLRFHLLDLSLASDSSLRGRAVVQWMLLALKYAWRGDLWRHVPAWLSTIRRARKESPIAAIELILRYMMEVSKTMPDTETQNQIATAVGEGPLEDAMSYSFPLLVAERRRARKEGRQEGQILTTRALVARLLERRFGPLPERYKSTLAAADEATLDRWFDRALGAATLDEVLTG